MDLEEEVFGGVTEKTVFTDNSDERIRETGGRLGGTWAGNVPRKQKFGNEGPFRVNGPQSSTSSMSIRQFWQG